jgi:predicted DNA-binding transcriptional regulator YafY
VSTSRTERLLALALAMINSTRPLTRSEIQSAVHDYPVDASQVAFERMFERDKDELRTMGVPLESVEVDGPEGIGYQVEKSNAFLIPIHATEQERLALALASRIWQEVSWSHAATTALRKLELVDGFRSSPDPTFAFSMPVDSTLLTDVLAAAHSKQRVSFDYRTGDEAKVQTRHLQPWGVVAARGHWYLVGHDEDRDATRAFRLSRFTTDLRVIKQTDAFIPPADTDLRDLVLSDFASDNRVDLTVKLTADRGAKLRSMAESVVANVAEFPKADPGIMIAEVLRAGPDAQIVHPAWVRTTVEANLQRLIDTQSVTIDEADRSTLTKAVSRHSKVAAETSVEQLGRLLALIPWLRANQGATYEQAAAHFGVSVDRLKKDLTLAVCTEFGPHLLTLDMDIWDQTIYVRDSRGIETPLRFTEPEVFSLLIGLHLLTQVRGPHDVAAIATISDKLRVIAGDSSLLTNHLTVDGQLAKASPIAPEILSGAEQSLAQRAALELVYVSASADRTSVRVVDPMGLVTTQGVEYLQAWCRSAEAVRLFRLDRVTTLRVLDVPAEVPEQAGGLLSSINPQGVRTLFTVDPRASWWIDHVPNEGTVTLADGHILVQLQVASRQWAVRTVLGFGGDLAVVEPLSLADEVRQAARSALACYDS